MKYFKQVISWILPIIIGLILALLVRHFFFTMVRVDGSSMQPSLKDKERVAAIKTSQLKRYSVVVFNAYNVDPNQTSKQAVYVKRIIGVPGDSIKYTNTGKLYINGKLSKQNYLKDTFQATTGTFMLNSNAKFSRWTLTSLSITQPDWNLSPKPINNKVPKNYYFVMGDHRKVSNDSRYWGFVPKNKMLGTIYDWPWSPHHEYINDYSTN